MNANKTNEIAMRAAKHPRLNGRGYLALVAGSRLQNGRGKTASLQLWLARWVGYAAFVGAVLTAEVYWGGTYVVRLPEELLHPAEQTLTLLDRNGSEIAIVPKGRARVADAISLADMGRWLPAVTVGLEDRRFWEHGGTDGRALIGATWQNVRSGRIVSGASTIAQQLIKTTRGRSGPRWWNKIAETLAARRLVREWPRERILQEYLNRIDYGNRRLGPRAAARAYFAKEPIDLTPAEAVYLAGLPQAPTRYNPWLHPTEAERRYQRSVLVLQATGVIDAVSARELALAPPVLSRRKPDNLAPHFVEALTQRSPELRGRVATTLDLELQRSVATLVRDHVARLAGRGVTQAAVVVLDNRDGAVRVLVGSADLSAQAGQINGALLPRSCGSVLKPFLYLQAIEERKLTAASILPDTPDAIHSAYLDYNPQNFDQTFLGPVRLREALGNSLNVPAVYALSLVGARSCFEHLRLAGFRFPHDLREYGAGLILGNAETRLIDVAGGFAGIAAQGRAPTPRFMAAEIPQSRRIASTEAAAIVADILCDDDARRRAFGRDSALAFPVRVPCKTGTSSNFRDAWTVGSTAQHTVAVWAGNFNGRPMDAVASIEAAAPLWRSIIEILLRTDDEVAAPVASERLVARDVCRLTGRIPTAASPGSVPEWFLAGTEPSETADVWLKKAGSESARVVLPREYATWCGSPYNLMGAEVEASAKITVRVPRAGAAYTIDPELAARQQMLRLEAELPADADARWEVDGKPVERVGGMPLWRLAEGQHVAVVTVGERRATAAFRVKTMRR